MPTRDAYTAAMQNPGDRFRDPELANGRTVRKASGQPIVYSGQFASVYRMSGKGRDHAVRCFVSEVPNRQQRYRALSDYLNIMRPPGFVPFAYLPRELLVRGERHPVLKMDWVEGKTLDRYIDANLANPSALSALATGWLRLMKDLQSMPMAHNDLQHGNIIVKPTGDLRLVDYDGVFLVPFKGERSPELGHRNYQHPSRTAQDYDEHVDNFPALVIHLSLMAIARDPSLWGRFHADDNLLFTKDDLVHPAGTPLWSELERCPDPEVRALTAELQRCCRLPVSQVPALDSILGRRPASGNATARPARTARLTLKTPIGRRQSTTTGGANPSTRISSAPPGTSGRQVPSPGVTVRTRAGRPGGSGVRSPSIEAKSRLGRLTHFIRKSTKAAAYAGRLVGRTTFRSLSAFRRIICNIHLHEDRMVTGLYLLALLTLLAFVVLGLYHMIGNIVAILATLLVCSGVATAVYIWQANRP